MDIYWIDKDKKKQGPEPEVVIVTKLETGELTPETMAWHKGCSGWIRIDELPALSSYFLKQGETNDWDSENEEFPNEAGDSSRGGLSGEVQVAIVPTPGPLVRFWARMFDLLFYMTLVLSLLTWLAPKPEEIYMDPRFLFFMWFPWIFIEALLLRWWGTTPGKFLCGISLHSLNSLEYRKVPVLSTGVDTAHEHKRKNGLSFTQTFRRSLQVMFFGMGFMLFYLTMVAGFVSLFLLKKRGETLWDRANGTVESYRPMGMADWFIFIVSFVTLSYVNGIIASPWLLKIPQLANLFQQLNN